MDMQFWEKEEMLNKRNQTELQKKSLLCRWQKFIGIRWEAEHNRFLSKIHSYWIYLLIYLFWAVEKEQSILSLSCSCKHKYKRLIKTQFQENLTVLERKKNASLQFYLIREHNKNTIKQAIYKTI